MWHPLSAKGLRPQSFFYVDIKRTLKTVKENIQISDEESRVFDLKQHRPWFDEG
jgi:hypothetical protein